MDTRKLEFEIHLFDEHFYSEALLNKTRSILNDVESLNKFWENGNHDCKNDNDILDLFQNIIINTGGISRFFWPSKNTGYHKSRGQKLCEVYHVNDLSILKNRNMRNLIEHFDENLDDFLMENKIYKVMQKYVGPRTYVDDNRTFFRAYFYDEKIFKMLNVEYEIKPIIDEIKRIHEILLLQQENRGRFQLESKSKE